MHKLQGKHSCFVKSSLVASVRDFTYTDSSEVMERMNSYEQLETLSKLSALRLIFPPRPVSNNSWSSLYWHFKGEWETWVTGVDFLKEWLDCEFKVASSKAGNKLAVMSGAWPCAHHSQVGLTRSEINVQLVCPWAWWHCVWFGFVLFLTHGLNLLPNKVSHLEK